ncbi:MAG: tetratricopeptide repeat protein [Gammaproteobacteria bacterium]|nr:tetratricopeptide repeat protein [Gammaproteobacteria bacterium]
MKSLLVDALRSAQTDSPGEEPGEEVVAEETAGRRKSTGAVTLPDSFADDISLLATGVFNREQLDAVAEPVDDRDLVLEPPGEVDLQDRAVVDPAERSPPLDDSEMRGQRTPAPESMLARIARLSPVICLATMLLAAGGFVFVQNLSGEYLNADLKELSEKVRTQPVVADENAQPVTADDRFANATNVAPDVVADAGVGGPGLPADPVITAVARNYIEPVADQPSAQEAAQVAVQSSLVSRTTRRVVNDRAFTAIATAYDALQRGDTISAEKNYRRALEIAPHHPDALLGLAAVLQGSGRVADSAALYARALELDPANEIAAAALISMNDQVSSDDAIAALKTLLGQYPDSAYIMFVLGVRYVDAGLWPEASVAFRGAHSADPANADYSYNLAVSLEKLGDLAAAIGYFEQTIETAAADSDFDVPALRRHVKEIAALVGEPL